MESLFGKEKLEVVLKHDQEDVQGIEIDIRDILEVVIKGKWLIAIFVAVSLILTTVGYYFTRPYTGTTSMIISFNFNGIEKGLDPYGNNFDAGKIKSPVLVQKVVDNLGLSKLNISADDIRTNIEIIPVIPGDITEKIKGLEEARKENIKDVQDFTYYPNKYNINFTVPKAFNISSSKAREIIDELFKQYQVYFFYTYADTAVLSNALGTLDYSEYDYPEISTVIHNQIQLIDNYLATKGKEQAASDFRSKKTGLSFTDIIASVNVVEKVDVNRIDSIIGAFNLTKDKEKLIKLYEYRIKMNSVTTAKKNDESAIYSGMLGKYQKDKNVILASGLGDETNSLEMSKTSKYYDELMDKTATAGVDAKDALHDSEYYKNEIEKLTKDTVSIQSKNAAEQEVLKLIPGVKTKLENWIKLTNDTVEEYYQTQLYNKAITKLSPAEYKSMNQGMKQYLAIGAGIGLILGLFVVLFREYWKRSGKKLAEKQVEA